MFHNASRRIGHVAEAEQTRSTDQAMGDFPDRLRVMSLRRFAQRCRTIRTLFPKPPAQAQHLGMKSLFVSQSCALLQFLRICQSKSEKRN
jgi:hypothetical protein